MNEVIPDRWVVIRLGKYYKVLASFGGGYLDGDEWKLNSGISKIEEDENYMIFHGYSGSVYKCQKGSYGMNSIASGIWITIQTKSPKELEIEMMDENTDWKSLKLEKTY